MTHTYNITGLTCNNCVAKAKSELLKLGDVVEADVKLSAPQATIKMQRHISTEILQSALSKAGHYTITEAGGSLHHNVALPSGVSWFQTYKPILLFGAYILGISLLLETGKGYFNWHSWMQHFMALMFLGFSFFKMLDLKGFADSYSMYDVIAKRWTGWGYAYAFIELGLGLSFALGTFPILTNGVTFVVIGVSLIGVLQAVSRRQKIKCACLGAVFNLPMSTLTIIEDVIMLLMSMAMLIALV